MKNIWEQRTMLSKDEPGIYGNDPKIRELTPTDKFYRGASYEDTPTKDDIGTAPGRQVRNPATVDVLETL